MSWTCDSSAAASNTKAMCNVNVTPEPDTVDPHDSLLSPAHGCKITPSHCYATNRAQYHDPSMISAHTAIVKQNNVNIRTEKQEVSGESDWLCHCSDVSNKRTMEQTKTSQTDPDPSDVSVSTCTQLVVQSLKRNHSLTTGRGGTCYQVEAKNQNLVSEGDTKVWAGQCSSNQTVSEKQKK